FHTSGSSGRRGPIRSLNSVTEHASSWCETWPTSGIWACTPVNGQHLTSQNIDYAATSRGKAFLISTRDDGVATLFGMTESLREQPHFGGSTLESFVILRKR